MENFEMTAKCLHGFESILAKELRNLGAMNVSEGVRHVRFMGDLGFMYKANLSLRTAVSVLKPILNFKIFKEQDFYQSVYEFPWEDFVDKNGSFAIDSTVNSDIFTHSRYVVFRAKDAIVDRFRDKFGTRPNIDTNEPDVRLNVHIDRNTCNLSLNTSGEPLFKRGYRKSTNIAPLNEVLAASLLLASGWDGQCDFLDPMCGSGTILIEAAMIACQIPANINRENFAFMKWNNFNEDFFEKIKDSTLKKMRPFHFKIKGYDLSGVTLSKAQENIENANLTEFISVEQADFFTTEKLADRHLFMLFNPPYGERLPVEVPRFYSSVGDTLKQNYPDTTAWFIVPLESGAIKHVGLRPSRKIKVFNASIESRLLRYDIYKGSKKAKYQN
ncbi:class I SAM-dependent RNA methyltransferase [Psychroflexus sp. ALD_RP9]|uniref:THUMP domain-containing class I SAM-dependent RNA methyltransferase n=1 Tax=Psychroflexus sp. ALD_RP9 TaxID=2777186 RepID=UPI001A8C178E|nr:class I SAM-dependent RNA methyltransferase [Psychroflexus sp. ALD_RP9]QSS96890.1 class I SAM-dependent RNA methyltransferase [Psychroflexus sp. ALD_RP9]